MVIFFEGYTMILLSAAESRELDRISQEKYGIPSYSLMTRAGEAVADTLVERFPEATTDVLVVAGKGNNGGDGFVVGRRLIQDGFAVRAVAARPRDGPERRRSARACGFPRKRRQSDRGARRSQSRSRARQTSHRHHRCDLRHRTQRGGERRGAACNRDCQFIRSADRRRRYRIGRECRHRRDHGRGDSQPR